MMAIEGTETAAASGRETAPAAARDRARWLGAAGIAYAVLILVGDDVIGGESPGLDSTRAEVGRYLREQHGEARQWLGRLVALAGVALFAVFFTRLYARLRTARSAWLPELALGAGLVAVAVHFVAYAPVGALAIAEDRNFGLEASRLAFVLTSTLFVLWWAPAAVALLATATIVLRERVLPRWFGWVTLVQAVAFVAGLVVLQASYGGFIAYPLFWLWLVAAAVALVRHE